MTNRESVIEASWDSINHDCRIAVLVACGWVTAKGHPDRAARSASNKHWSQLSPAMRRIILNRAELDRLRAEATQ